MSNISPVNSVENISSTNYTSTAKKAEESAAESSAPKTSEAAVYERSDNTDKVTIKNSSKYSKNENIDRSDLISKLQADAEAQVANLKGIVEKLLKGQSKSYAIAKTDDETDSIWDHLRKGDFEVDAAYNY